MSYDATKWAWMTIRGNPQLASTRRLLLLALADFHNGKSGQCNPSLNTLVADTGMHRTTIPDAIRDLEREGIVSVSRRFGAGSEYTLVGFSTSTENRTSTETVTGTENRQEPVRKTDNTGTENRTLTKKNQEENQEETHKQHAHEENTRPENTNPGSEGPHNEKPKPMTRKPKAKAELSEVTEWKGPSDRCYELAEKAGIPRDFVDAQVGEFFLYWEDTKQRKPGWDATFLNRCKDQWSRYGRDWQRKTPQTGQVQAGFIGNNQPGQFMTRHERNQAITRRNLAEWLEESEVKERAIN